jgi:hypothetical protein
MNPREKTTTSAYRHAQEHLLPVMSRGAFRWSGPGGVPHLAAFSRNFSPDLGPALRQVGAVQVGLDWLGLGPSTSACSTNWAAARPGCS